MSLGFHNGNNKRVPARKQPAVAAVPTETQKTSTTAGAYFFDTRKKRTSPLLTLIILNAALFVGHLGAAIAAAVYDIRYPLTVFETRIDNSTIARFTCDYEYTLNEDNERYCTDESLVKTGNYSDIGDCAQFFNVSNGTIVSTNVFVNDAGSPQLSIYETVAFTLGSDTSTTAIAEEGRRATRWILFSIEFVTALFHLTYTLTFVRMRWFDPQRRIEERVMNAGGLPCRWYEYAFTASLMSFFVSNGAAVYDLYALLGIGLATFALMYFGILIEFMLYQGRAHVATMLLYVPGTALFVAGWVGSIRQMFTDVAALTCRDGSSNALSCDKTCFGNQVPIPMFIFALLLLFLLFPLILLYKIYTVGGWRRAWTTPAYRGLDFVCCTEQFPSTRLVQGPLRFLTDMAFFSVFVVWGIAISLSTILRDCFWYVSPSLSAETYVRPDEDVRWRAFWQGELHYALASASSKFFLFIYFMMSFADRGW